MFMPLTIYIQGQCKCTYHQNTCSDSIRFSTSLKRITFFSELTMNYLPL